MKNTTFNILISSLIFLAACGKGSSGLKFKVNDVSQSTLSPDTKVSYADIKSEILQPHCLSCHGDVSTEKGLSKWVTPGKPNSSAFFTEVESGSMPKDQNPLSTRDLELIKLYIEQLAATNPTGTTTGSGTAGSTTGTSSGGATNPGTNGITFDEVKTKVLSPYRCLNCHSVGTEAKLTKWINMTTPEKSLFYTTIKSGSMPQGGPRAGTAIQDFVLQYVTDFATR